MSKVLAQLLSPFLQEIEAALLRKISLFKSKTKLAEACEYSLMQGGKRFRPALVLMVAKALHSKHDVMDAALAVEFFHTASLIADDLPCMDDDKERRGKPASHIVFGEAIALLASYALISEGYQGLTDNAATLERAGVLNASKIGMLATENASYNTGIFGATGGQYLDLFPPQRDDATYRETVMKKTVSLFEISFVLGWLFGGGDLEKLPLVKTTAYHYGMAFQIADDFDDYKADLAEERLMNAVSLFGKDEALIMFQTELKSYLEGLKTLQIDSIELTTLGRALVEMMKTSV
jgi:geranylgeranyl diphosphate synthase type II